MTIASRRDTTMFNANRFKLGLFAPNCSNGLAMTTVPERWVASWENNLALAGRAEEAGLEFILPIARWHGYDGAEVTAQESTLETVSWAIGMLAATRRLSIFGTDSFSIDQSGFRRQADRHGRSHRHAAGLD